VGDRTLVLQNICFPGQAIVRQRPIEFSRRAVLLPAMFKRVIRTALVLGLVLTFAGAPALALEPKPTSIRASRS